MMSYEAIKMFQKRKYMFLLVHFVNIVVAKLNEEEIGTNYAIKHDMSSFNKRKTERERENQRFFERNHTCENFSLK